MKSSAGFAHFRENLNFSATASMRNLSVPTGLVAKKGEFISDYFVWICKSFQSVHSDNE